MNKKSGFKMKGHTLPGINQRSDTPNTPDGRSKSSAFQMGTSMGAINTAKKTKAGKGTHDALQAKGKEHQAWKASRKAKGAANMAKTKASQKIMSGGKSKFQSDVAARKATSKISNTTKKTHATKFAPTGHKGNDVLTKNIMDVSELSADNLRKLFPSKGILPQTVKEKSPFDKESPAKKHKKSAAKKHKKSPVYKKGYHTMPDGTIMKDSEHKESPAKKHKKSPAKNYKKGYYGA